MNPLIQFAETCIDCGKETWHAKKGPRCPECDAEYATQLRILDDHPDLSLFNRFAESFYGFEFPDGRSSTRHN